MNGGSIVARSVIGTKSFARVPRVVPSNPRGATPTTVSGWPFTTSVLPSTSASCLKRVTQ